jgi:Cys/Met metabolism PLP-dependent enzyme
MSSNSSSSSSSNGGKNDNGATAASFLEKAIQMADPYRGRGTAYLHTSSSSSSSVNSNTSNGNDSVGGSDNANKRLKTSNGDYNIENPTGAVVVPISLATTFKQSSPGRATATNDPNSFGQGFEYSRTGNPTRGALERAICQAEQGSKHCVAFASGSAATSAVLHLLQCGDHVLCVDDVYGGTQRYFRRIVQPAMNIQVDFVDFNKRLNEGNGELPLTDKTKVRLETGRPCRNVCSSHHFTTSRYPFYWIISQFLPSLFLSLYIRSSFGWKHQPIPHLKLPISPKWPPRSKNTTTTTTTHRATPRHHRHVSWRSTIHFYHPTFKVPYFSVPI